MVALRAGPTGSPAAGSTGWERSGDGAQQIKPWRHSVEKRPALAIGTVYRMNSSKPAARPLLMHEALHSSKSADLPGATKLPIKELELNPQHPMRQRCRDAQAPYQQSGNQISRALPNCATLAGHGKAAGSNGPQFATCQLAVGGRSTTRRVHRGNAHREAPSPKRATADYCTIRAGRLGSRGDSLRRFARSRADNCSRSHTASGHPRSPCQIVQYRPAVPKDGGM